MWYSYTEILQKMLRGEMWAYNPLPGRNIHIDRFRENMLSFLYVSLSYFNFLASSYYY